MRGLKPRSTRQKSKRIANPPGFEKQAETRFADRGGKTLPNVSMDKA
jgi:hypothetical protein